MPINSRRTSLPVYVSKRVDGYRLWTKFGYYYPTPRIENDPREQAETFLFLLFFYKLMIARASALDPCPSELTAATVRLMPP